MVSPGEGEFEYAGADLADQKAVIGCGEGQEAGYPSGLDQPGPDRQLVMGDGPIHFQPVAIVVR